MPNSNNCHDKDKLLQYGTIIADFQGEYFPEQNGIDYVGRHLLKHTPSTKLKNTTFHSDCQNLLLKKASDWKEVKKENACSCCMKQYIRDEISIMSALNNRKLGIQKSHENICLQCITKYNKQNTMALKISSGENNKSDEIHALAKEERSIQYRQFTERTETIHSKTTKNSEFNFSIKFYD